MRHFLHRLRLVAILVAVPVGGSILACGGGGGEAGASLDGSTNVTPAVGPGHLVYPPVTSTSLSGKYGMMSWMEQTGGSYSVYAKIYSNGAWGLPVRIGTTVGGGTSIDAAMQTATDPNGNCVQVQIVHSASGSNILASTNRPSDRSRVDQLVIYSTSLEASALTIGLEPAKTAGGSTLYYVATVGWSEKMVSTSGAVGYAARSCRFRTDTLEAIYDLTKIVAILPTLSSPTAPAGDATSGTGSGVAVYVAGASSGTTTLSPTLSSFQP